MAYKKFTGVGGPDDVLTKISECVKEAGWTILDNCISDLDISGSGTQDGKKLAFKDVNNKVIAVLRSANGSKIFPDQRISGSPPVYETKSLDYDVDTLSSSLPPNTEQVQIMGINYSSDNMGNKPSPDYGSQPLYISFNNKTYRASLTDIYNQSHAYGDIPDSCLAYGFPSRNNLLIAKWIADGNLTEVSNVKEYISGQNYQIGDLLYFAPVFQNSFNPLRKVTKNFTASGDTGIDIRAGNLGTPKDDPTNSKPEAKISDFYSDLLFGDYVNNHATSTTSGQGSVPSASKDVQGINKLIKYNEHYYLTLTDIYTQYPTPASNHQIMYYDKDHNDTVVNLWLSDNNIKQISYEIGASFLANDDVLDTSTMYVYTAKKDFVASGSISTDIAAGNIQKNIISGGYSSYGIGLICADDYTSSPASGFWYDQINAPLSYNEQKNIGVGIPINPDGGNTLIVNIINKPAPMIVISISNDYDESSPAAVSASTWQHMAAGCIQKLGKWNGGMIISASRNSYDMFPTDGTFSALNLESETKPLFGTSLDGNTFLRADIDGAPMRTPAVHWSSACSQNGKLYIGNQLATPVFSKDALNADWVAHVPDYTKLQAASSLDSGINVNTLNCITVNMNILCYFLRDPYELKSFSPCGYVTGIYYISLFNLAPSSLYEISYPQSGDMHQAFPYSRRRGLYGYDGFSIQQADKDDTPTTP